jgi:23S rRNA pseudouridine1911/1915/1917 synthase
VAAPYDASPPTLAARVRAQLPGTSWEQARALCRAGRVTVDGRRELEPASRPPEGAEVGVLSPAAAAAAARQEGGGGGTSGSGGLGGAGGAGGWRSAAAGEAERRLVVYADADVVVVRKPAGILTVPFERADRDTLLALTRVALRRRAAAAARASAAGEGRGGGGRGGEGAAREAAAPGREAGNPTLRAVQRLDKDTSGLLVFARTVAAQRHLQAQLAERRVTRGYQALVHGVARGATYDTWLVEDRGDGLRGSLAMHDPDAMEAPPAGARRAVTHVRVLATLRGATHVACTLDTGRQHQIRIHLAEAGHPLLGETVYIRDYRGSRLAAPRPMLHAALLGFLHPRDDRPLRFEDPPPDDFAQLLAALAVSPPRSSSRRG